MTEVSFHTKVAEPLGYACRLLRKAVQRGTQVVVSATPETLRRLDQLLWSFEPFAFVPHGLVREGQSIPARLRPTPVWLVPPGANAPTHDVLVNLGAELVVGFESYQRVVEIVGTEADAAQAARQRWRHYKERGYPIVHHEAG